VKTALILLVPEAEALVDDLRHAHDPAVLQGVPAHITVLYPFRPLERLDDAAMGQAERLIGDLPAIDISFRAVGRFPGVLYLAPEPRAPIDRLTQALAAAFPDCPPYGGKFPDPIPHLTFALGDETVLDGVELEMRTRLRAPIRARIDSCSLFKFADDRWREAARFGFGV